MAMSLPPWWKKLQPRTRVSKIILCMVILLMGESSVVGDFVGRGKAWKKNQWVFEIIAKVCAYSLWL